MKVLKLLIFCLLFTLSAVAQTTPWSSTPVATPQTRTLSGSPQIRWIWNTGHIYSVADSLASLKHYTDSLIAARGSLIPTNGLQRISGTPDSIGAGGTLTQDVSIDGLSHNYIISAHNADESSLLFVTPTLTGFSKVVGNDTYSFGVQSGIGAGNAPGAILTYENGATTTDSYIRVNGRSMTVFDGNHNTALKDSVHHTVTSPLQLAEIQDVSDMIASGGIDTTALARKTGNAAMQQSSYKSNGTGGNGYVALSNQSVSPTKVSGTLKMYRDSVGSLGYINGLYRRTFKIKRMADQTINFPYASNPTLADSTDIATVTNRKQDTLGTSGPATLTFGALRPVYDTVHAVNTWAFVSDAVHSPSPAFTSITATSTYIQLNYSTFSHVNVGFNVNDEAMSSLGIFAGSSVGLGSTKLYIYRQLDDYVEATYTASTTSWALTGNNLTGASISFNTTSKILTFANPNWGVIPQNINITMHSPDGTLANNTNKYIPIPFSYSVPNTINFRLLKLTGDYLPALTDGLKIIFHYSGIVQLNPSTFNFNIVGGSANFWVFGMFKR